jgi:hypothetical protein
MSRALGLAALLLTGCKPDAVDFVVDASDFAATFPDALFKVDLVFDGETVQHAELDLSETNKVTFADAINPVTEYGVAAYADQDADGLCEPGSDVGWLIIYSPLPRVDFLWEPDATVARDDGYACAWFGDFATDTDVGSDTDDTDGGADTDGG